MCVPLQTEILQERHRVSVVHPGGGGGGVSLQDDIGVVHFTPDEGPGVCFSNVCDSSYKP